MLKGGQQLSPLFPAKGMRSWAHQSDFTPSKLSQASSPVLPYLSISQNTLRLELSEMASRSCPQSNSHLATRWVLVRICCQSQQIDSKPMCMCVYVCLYMGVRDRAREREGLF